MHPFMPFVTEELWQRVALVRNANNFEDDSSTVMLQPYPVRHSLQSEFFSL